MSSEKQNVVINNCRVDRDFTVRNIDNSRITNEIIVDGQTWEKSLTKRFAREMGNIIETVEKKIQSALLSAMDNLLTPRFELAVRSMNASSRLDTVSVTAILECGEQVHIISSFEYLSDSHNTVHELNVNDETRGNIPDEVSDFPVPRTHYDRQLHTYYKKKADLQNSRWFDG